MKIQMANTHVKKMLNIISHQGNAKQNHSELPLHSQQDGHNQEMESKHWYHMEKWEPLYTTDENVKMVQLLWKTVWQVLKQLNIIYHII